MYVYIPTYTPPYTHRGPDSRTRNICVHIYTSIQTQGKEMSVCVYIYTHVQAQGKDVSAYTYTHVQTQENKILCTYIHTFSNLR